MSNAKDALAALGINPDEAIEMDKKLTKKSVRDNRICICGHAIGRHKVDEYSALTECKPSRMYCPCQTERPVLQAEDTRMFLRQTTGPMSEHALIRGMAALVVADKEAKWIEDPKCDRCESNEGAVGPVPLTKNNKVAYEPSARNVFLCAKCLEEVR